MILSFHQISGQLGCKTKEVNQVLFEAKETNTIATTSGRRKQRRIERSKNTSLMCIRMATTGNEHVAIGLFHRFDDTKTDSIKLVDDFLNELLEDFSSRGLLQELLGMRDQLTDIAAEKPNLKFDREDVMNNFKSFEPVVEALRAKYRLDELTEE